MPRLTCPSALVPAVALYAIALSVGVQQARAGWAVTNLNPAGATNSKANGIRLGKEVGLVDGNTANWTGTAASYATFGPGALRGTDGVQQVGSPTAGNGGVWTGTPGSYVDLTPVPTPPAYGGQSVTGVFNGVQVGYGGGFFNNQFTNHAAFWQDSGASFVDLNPVGALASFANGVYNANVVGSVVLPSAFRPALWNNLPTNSYVDLTPLLATGGQAFGIFQNKQVGEVDIAGGSHAALWTGTSQSFVDLDVGTGISFAVAISGNGVVTTEAGWVAYGAGGVRHAAFWAGTSGSYVDLQSYLPAGFVSSEATGIWVNNAGISYITGFATDDAGHTNAMLWAQTVPEPTTIAAIGSLAIVMRRRRPV